MVWALQRIEKEKPAAGKTDYWHDFWRRRWDSNPRTLADQTISSRSRYDHFDTPPYSVFDVLSEKGENYTRELVIFRKRALRFLPVTTGIFSGQPSSKAMAFRVFSDHCMWGKFLSPANFNAENALCSKAFRAFGEKTGEKKLRLFRLKSKS